jgi:beta-lactamase class C
MMKLTAGLAALAVFAGITAATNAASARTDQEVETIVREQLAPLLSELVGGAAVAVRIDGRTLFYNFGVAHVVKKTPITTDTLFNLASISKTFDTTLLGLLVNRGELSLEDPVANYISELRKGGDIRKVTFGQLTTYTSGLELPPHETYTWPKFVRTLVRWKADKGHEPGKQSLYSHAGYMLMHVALERRYEMPYHELLQSRLMDRLDLPSTSLPAPGATYRPELPAELRSRAVQGYSEWGKPIGKPGDQQGYYQWGGTGQMYSSPRDLAKFLAANLGEELTDPELQAAMETARRGYFQMTRRIAQALAWEIRAGNLKIVEKYGGLNNSSIYMSMIHEKKVGLLIMMNRGGQDLEQLGRKLVLRLAGAEAKDVTEEEDEEQPDR